MSTKAKEGWVWTLWSQVHRKSKRRMRTAENLSLGGKRLLVLIECDGRPFLVGCGPDAVHCILPMPLAQDGLAMAGRWDSETGAENEVRAESGTGASE